MRNGGPNNEPGVIAALGNALETQNSSLRMLSASQRLLLDMIQRLEERVEVLEKELS